METWDTIRARRDVRSYDDRAITDADLDRVLEAARRTPSSRNSQRWDLVVVTDRGELQQLSQVWRGAGHVATSAATIALVAPMVEERVRASVHYDLGQITMSIMLAAADLGIGGGHAAVDDHDLAARLLALPDDRRCEWLVALGYPADRPLTPIEHPDRRPFDEVVHRSRW